jgi:AraC-like DNA-binding protein
LKQTGEHTEYQRGSALLFPHRGLRLHHMVCAGGQQLTCNPEYDYDGTQRGNRDIVFWQYTLSGCGAVEYGGKTIPVESGKAFLLIVPEKHRYYLPKTSSHWEFLYISFCGYELVRLASEIRRLSGAVSGHYGSPVIVEAARNIIDLVVDGNLTPYNASTLAYDFMMKLLSESESSSSTGLDLHQIMHNYCLKNIERHPDVEELAAVSGYSRGHFYRKFKEETGCNPHEFILDLKMRYALRKLQNENITIKEVAAACGFDDPSYFCKVFRKHYGVTPALFRTEKKKGENFL